MLKLAEDTMAGADKHKHLDEKYPTKRGFWDIVAKNVFLFLTHVTCNMKCIGKENFPANNPYVVASNHQSYPDGVLIIDYLPKGHFKWMCCLAASDLETNHGSLGRLIMRVGRGIAIDRYGNRRHTFRHRLSWRTQGRRMLPRHQGRHTAGSRIYFRCLPDLVKT